MVKKSPENTTPAIVDNVEALEAKLAQMREAQALFATYTQEQVDKIFYEAAMAANKARIPLAKMAIEETGRGVLEDKVIKNHYAAEYIYNAYKNTKTCGVLERDEAYGITKIAEPIGIVGAVIPTTNPTSTAIFKTLISLKTRNAIIISPHPAAAKCTIRDVVSTYIYTNTLVVLEMTRPALKQYIERSAAYFDHDENGSVCISGEFLLPKVQHYNYDFFSGIHYTIDARNPVGQRVTSIVFEGHELGEDEPVTVCINSYRFCGTGGYDMLPRQKVAREVLTDVADAMIDYITSHPNIRVDTEKYCTVIG